MQRGRNVQHRNPLRAYSRPSPERRGFSSSFVKLLVEIFPRIIVVSITALPLFLSICFTFVLSNRDFDALVGKRLAQVRRGPDTRELLRTPDLKRLAVDGC